MVVKSKNSSKIKTTHFDFVAQVYEHLKVNIDQTWPQHTTKNPDLVIITKQKMKYQ